MLMFVYLLAFFWFCIFLEYIFYYLEYPGNVLEYLDHLKIFRRLGIAFPYLEYLEDLDLLQGLYPRTVFEPTAKVEHVDKD